jgi:hypothetical protein
VLTVNHLARDEELMDVPQLKETDKWAWEDEKMGKGAPNTIEENPELRE